MDVEATIAALDRGEVRVAEKVDGDWRVNEEAKAAILEYFRVRKVEPIEVGPFEYLDKIPLKRDHAARGVRVVPPATARYGSFLSPGVILMPSYVNIGAWVGPNTMVDTWATVGSCAQIGADVHLAGGVGIGGVLEPVNARPVIVEDGAFIGSRCIVTEGCIVGEQAILGAGVVITASVPIIDVTGSEPVEHRGAVPPRAVVVPGVRQREFPAGDVRVADAADRGLAGRAPRPDVAERRAARVRDRHLRRPGASARPGEPHPHPKGGVALPPPSPTTVSGEPLRVRAGFVTGARQFLERLRRPGEPRAAAGEAHAQVAAGEVHDDLAVAVRRGRDRDGARARTPPSPPPRAPTRARSPRPAAPRARPARSSAPGNADASRAAGRALRSGSDRP